MVRKNQRRRYNDIILNVKLRLKINTVTGASSSKGKVVPVL